MYLCSVHLSLSCLSLLREFESNVTRHLATRYGEAEASSIDTIEEKEEEDN